MAIVAFMALILVAVARAMAGAAAVMNWWMGTGLALANNWQRDRAAVGHVNSTTRSGGTSAQDQACSHILVMIPIINPALAVWTGTLVGYGGGIEEVVNVNVGQMHSQSTANALSLASWDGGVDHYEIATGEGANVKMAVLLLLVIRINADRTIAHIVG